MKKYILLTPGPTPMPQETARAAAKPIVHHRTAEFGKIFSETTTWLRNLLGTKNPVLVTASSGTGAMESAVVNLLSPGDRVMVAACGVFGMRWAKIIRAYGLKPVVVEEEWGTPVGPGRLWLELKKHPRTKAVFTTHVETSTGTLNDIREIGRAVKKSGALLVVDAISSVGAEELRMDDWGVDVAVGASQKGLMNAPGLGFIGVSGRAWKICDAARLPRFYWDWRRMRDMLDKNQTPFTSAISLMAAQRESLRRIRREGIARVLKRSRAMAEATRAAASAMGLGIFSVSPSSALTAMELPGGIDGQELVKNILRRHNISIGGGQDKLRGKIVRIAHMGAITSGDVAAGLDALELELRRMGHKSMKRNN